MKTLYLGTDPTYVGREVTHYPVIDIALRGIPEHVLDALHTFTHLIFTSKNSVRLFFQVLKECRKTIPSVRFISVGKVTTEALISHSIEESLIITAQDECQEGVIDILCNHQDIQTILWPHSAQARPLLKTYLELHFKSCVMFSLYEPVPRKELPPIEIEEFDEIVFTSPSTVNAFWERFPTLPKKIVLVAQGAITKKVVQKLYNPHAVNILTSRIGG